MEIDAGEADAGEGEEEYVRSPKAEVEYENLSASEKTSGIGP